MGTALQGAATLGGQAVFPAGRYVLLARALRAVAQVGGMRGAVVVCWGVASLYDEERFELRPEAIEEPAHAKEHSSKGTEKTLTGQWLAAVAEATQMGVSPSSAAGRAAACLPGSWCGQTPGEGRLLVQAGVW